MVYIWYIYGIYTYVYIPCEVRVCCLTWRRYMYIHIYLTWYTYIHTYIHTYISWYIYIPWYMYHIPHMVYMYVYIACEVYMYVHVLYLRHVRQHTRIHTYIHIYHVRYIYGIYTMVYIWCIYHGMWYVMYICKRDIILQKRPLIPWYVVWNGELRVLQNIVSFIWLFCKRDLERVCYMYVYMVCTPWYTYIHIYIHIANPQLTCLRYMNVYIWRAYKHIYT